MSTLSPKNSSRNITLDLFKLLAAYSVVFIHNKFYGNFGFAVEAVARFAVPLFFVSSGYFCFNNSLDKIKAKAFRIAKMFLWASVMYHIVNLTFYVLQGKTNEIVPYLTGIFSFETIWRFLLTNLPYSSTPLWFLLALAYTYVVYYFVVKFKVPHKVMMIISCVIIAADIISWSILPNFGVVIPVVNCFVTFGVPFFTFGISFRKNQDKLKNTKTWVLVPMLVVGAVISIVSRLYYQSHELYNATVPEFLLCVQHTKPPVPELFVGSLLLVFAMVVISLKYPDINCPSWLVKLASCSTYIYIFHRLCGMIVVKGLKFVGVDTSTVLVTNLITIAVCILSTVVALVVLDFEARIKAKRKMKKA